VRPDVAAVLFDEPLTVIDPHLKWQLRRKLKQIHHELKLTLIYVTHDQVEALTFAEEVVVMTRGKVVQLGRPEALFERPAHTFVGHFIGSPGMNFLPVQSFGRTLGLGQHALTLPEDTATLPDGALTLGIRPEYVRLSATNAPGALPAVLQRRQDIGTYWMLTARLGEHEVKVRMAPDAELPEPGATVWLEVLGSHSCFYNTQQELIP
jgi:glycerol transport system ATP-binding protein